MSAAGGPDLITNGLVLHLDAASRRSYNGGTIWRDLAGSNNGTLTNGPTFSSANGGSIVFDGVDDYITLGNNKFKYTTTNFTVEVWCRYSNLPNNGGICSSRHPIIYNHDYGYNFFINSLGKFTFQVYNTNSNNVNINSLNSVIGENYIHVIGIKNGTNVSLYLNSIFQGSNNLTTNNIYYENFPFVIGGFGVCGGQYFYSQGNIASVKLYDRALTSAEILQNYNATRSRFGV